MAKNEIQCCEHCIYTHIHQEIHPKASKCSKGVMSSGLPRCGHLAAETKEAEGLFGSPLEPSGFLAALRQSQLLTNFNDASSAPALSRMTASVTAASSAISEVCLDLGIKDQMTECSAPFAFQVLPLWLLLRSSFKAVVHKQQCLADMLRQIMTAFRRFFPICNGSVVLCTMNLGRLGPRLSRFHGCT